MGWLQFVHEDDFVFIRTGRVVRPKACALLRTHTILLSRARERARAQLALEDNKIYVLRLDIIERRLECERKRCT
jgi:hypothetical protein